MSYVLHVWKGPAPASVRDASRAVFFGCPPVPAEALGAFVDTLTAACPDEELWVDSPLSRTPGEGAYVLGMVSARIDADLIPFIAHAAADRGLHVLDMQAARVYRADRTVVDDRGTVQSLGVRRAPAARQPPPAEPLRPQEVSRRIVDLLAQRLASREWQPHHGDSPLDEVLWRQVGDVRQQIEITVADFDHDGRRWCIYVSLSFSCDELGAALLQWLPEERASREWAAANAGVRVADIRATRYEVFGPADGFELDEVLTADGFEAWADRFLAWYIAFAAAPLQAAGNLRSLSLLLLTRFYRKYFVGTNWTLFHVPLLAYLTAHPELGEWMDKIREKNQEQHGSAMRPGAPVHDSHVAWLRDKGLHVLLLLDRLAQGRPPAG